MQDAHGGTSGIRAPCPRGLVYWIILDKLVWRDKVHLVEAAAKPAVQAPDSKLLF